MKRRHLCDVPGCGRERHRWQRLCTGCFAALPGDIRFAILDCWKRRDRAEHGRACRRARDFVADRGTAPVRHCGHRPTPEQFAARTAAQLGERDIPL